MMSRLVLLTAGALLSIPSPTLAQEEIGRTFKFTKVDLVLLEEAKEVDRQLEKKGTLFSDLELAAYLQYVTERMVGGRPSPERSRIACASCGICG